MPICRVQSVKIYTGQKKFTRVYPWDPWQIRGMEQITTNISFILYRCVCTRYTWRMKKSMKRSGWSVSEANAQRRSRATTFSPKTWKKSLWWSTGLQQLSWNLFLSILPGRAMQSRLLISLGAVGGLGIPDNLSSHWIRGYVAVFFKSRLPKIHNN